MTGLRSLLQEKDMNPAGDYALSTFHSEQKVRFWRLLADNTILKRWSPYSQIYLALLYRTHPNHIYSTVVGEGGSILKKSKIGNTICQAGKLLEHTLMFSLQNSLQNTELCALKLYLL